MMAQELLREHWEEVGRITGCDDVIVQHEELGDMHWGGNKYDARILQVLAEVADRCPEKLDELEQFVEAICAVEEGHEYSNVTLIRR